MTLKNVELVSSPVYQLMIHNNIEESRSSGFNVDITNENLMTIKLMVVGFQLLF